MNEKHHALNEKSQLDARVSELVRIFSSECANISKILDIGCGNGKITMLLKTCSCAQEACGIDADAESLKTAKKAGVKTFNLDLDEDTFPFESNYFDAVVAGEVIEHLVNPDHLLDEAHRTLKQGGLFFITTPNLSAWYNRVALLLGFQPFWTDVSTRFPDTGKVVAMGIGGKHLNDYHLRVFTYRALKELLELHDFKIKNHLALAACTKNQLFDGIERLASFINASSGMLFVASKA